jgi:hypothetical protein
VLNEGRVKIDTDDDTAGIDPGCTRENGSWGIERREYTMTQQKRVRICPLDASIA